MTGARRSLLLAALLTSSALGASPSYFPGTPGTTWRYSSGETQRVERARTVRGVSVVPVSHSFGGQEVSQDLLEYRDGGVYLRGVQTTVGRAARLTWYNPPLTIYPDSPLSPGQFWSSASGSLRLSGRVLGTQAVTTPAGSFNTLIIRNELNAAGGLTVQYSYFVPGLGVVRFQTADGATTDLLR